MSARTPEQLDDLLAEDLIWRKREISSLKLSAEAAPPERQPAMLRAALSMLYAHWEGFVKTAATAYIRFVSLQRLRYAELSANFLALSVRRLLRPASEANRIGAHIAVAEFFLRDLERQSSLPHRDEIRAEGNLSARVLHEVIDTLGLDYSPFEMKARLIDEILLKTRNTIAHGEYLLIDMSRYRELSAEVVEMLDIFRVQVSNAAALQQYRRK